MSFHLWSCSENLFHLHKSSHVNMNFDMQREHIPMNVASTGFFLLLLQFTQSSKGVGNIQLKIHTRLNSFVSKLKSFVSPEWGESAYRITFCKLISFNVTTTIYTNNFLYLINPKWFLWHHVFPGPGKCDFMAFNCFHPTE